MCCSAISASGMDFIDGSMVSLVMPIIREDFGSSLVNAQLSSIPYIPFCRCSSCSVELMTTCSTCANIFVAGIALLMLTSTVYALAVDVDHAVIVMRATFDIVKGGGGAYGAGQSHHHRQVLPRRDAQQVDRPVGSILVTDQNPWGPFVGVMVMFFGTDRM